MEMRPFDEIEHTTDRAFRARGRNFRELFEHAAQAMFALEAGCEGQPVVGPVRDVAVAGFDRETLLINWLNELLYLHKVHKENYAISRFSRSLTYGCGHGCGCAGEVRFGV